MRHGSLNSLLQEALYLISSKLTAGLVLHGEHPSEPELSWGMDWSLFWKWHGSCNNGVTSLIDSVISSPEPYTPTRNPEPYTLHPTPYTLHPTPYTRHPTPYTLHPTPYTLHPTPNAASLAQALWAAMEEDETDEDAGS